jgi:hypothetical protein
MRSNQRAKIGIAAIDDTEHRIKRDIDAHYVAIAMTSKFALKETSRSLRISREDRATKLDPRDLHAHRCIRGKLRAKLCKQLIRVVSPANRIEKSCTKFCLFARMDRRLEPSDARSELFSRLDTKFECHRLRKFSDARRCFSLARPRRDLIDERLCA